MMALRQHKDSVVYLCDASAGTSIDDTPTQSPECESERTFGKDTTKSFDSPLGPWLALAQPSRTFGEVTLMRCRRVNQPAACLPRFDDFRVKRGLRFAVEQRPERESKGCLTVALCSSSTSVQRSAKRCRDIR
jgi:hypothetical protein